MTGDKKITWIYAISIAVWIISFTAWRFWGLPFFYIGNALVIFGIVLVVHLRSPIPKWLSSFGVFVASNNLIDEMLLDPLELNISEYIVGSIALIYYYNKYKKRK